MYEYKCPLCDEQKILLRGILDADSLPVCEKDGREMVLMPSVPAGFILKGAGFHRNDYRNGSR